MPLKVVVELQIHAVTCPGVFLANKNDIFLSVHILGQSKETRSLPAVFPLLFHEKMRFEKVFRKPIDPAAVVQVLEKYTAVFELIQLRRVGEEVLATYTENHREFLFPEPKLTPAYPGVDRELLMKTASGFPGIAPKIEFSSSTTIKEKPNDFQNKHPSMKAQSRRSLPNSPSRKSRTPTKSYSSPEKSYSSPTTSSKYRSPSPYTQKRMCELNNDNEQRLAHLSLGNYEFKSDADSRPPFLVDLTNAMGEKVSPQLPSPKQKRHASGHGLRRALTIGDQQHRTSAEEDCLDLNDLNTSRKVSPSALSTYSSQGLTTNTAHRGTLWQSFQSENNTWESIHNRVRSLLSTHSAKQRLFLDISEDEVDQILERSSRRSPNNSLQKVAFNNN
ncbi:spermatogenesis associated 6-like protein isoform X2 [Pseudophryne corroboree]|uniref:spermatogenesis associated 6-like protein isoform X2 n=1 Tax=Pseudophryne corroboree TaxID=495146 RepID=UPI003081FE04